MGRIGTFLSGMIAGAVLLFLANHYHLVRGNEGVFVVPKVSQNLKDTYVDIRKFGLSDWQEHRMLAASLLRSDHKAVLEDTSLSGVRKAAVSLMTELLGES